MEHGMKPTVYAPYLSLVALAACNSISSPINHAPPPPAYTTFETLGDSISIAAKLDEFRAALGGSLNAPNTPPADSGRREINWDGVPAALTDVDTFPANFFNVNSKRGVVFTTPGSGFRIDSTDFASVNAGLAAQFKFFSPKKLFMAVGSNQLDIDFKVVGTATNGLVKGFGAVFSDVDKLGSTTIEFFDANGVRIALLKAPNHNSTQLLSFSGAVFDEPIIARVRITSGEAALSATSVDVTAGGTQDLVVMDDFVYGEPHP
jgi:hypothetical protein